MGALTSKPYAFISRSWELKSIETIDIFDTSLSSVRYDYRNNQVLRVLPSINSNTNVEWIADRVRFYYDSILISRISTVWLRGIIVEHYLNNECQYKHYYSENIQIACSWVFSIEILRFIFQFHQSNKIGTVEFSYKLSSTEGLLSSLTCFQLQNLTGTDNTFLIQHAFCDIKNNYYFNSTVLNNVDLLFLINCNLRFDMPILNLQLCGLVKENKLSVYTFGENCSYNYSVICLGNSNSSFYEFLVGRAINSELINKFSNIFLLFGINTIRDITLQDLYNFCLKQNFFINKKIKESSLFTSPMHLNILEHCGLIQDDFLLNDNNKIFYFINTDTITVSTKQYLSKFFDKCIIYAGSHSDFITEFADVIFPISMNIEMNEIYLNTSLQYKNNSVILLPTITSIRKTSNLNNLLQQIVMSLNEKNKYINKVLLCNQSMIGQLPSCCVEEKIANKHNNQKQFFSIWTQNILNKLSSYLIGNSTKASRILNLASNIFIKNTKNF